VVELRPLIVVKDALMRLMTFGLILIGLLPPPATLAQDNLTVDLPVEIRQWFRNPDGSCV